LPPPLNPALPDFWYYQRNINDGVDNPEFGICYGLTTRFMVFANLLHH